MHAGKLSADDYRYTLLLTIPAWTISNDCLHLDFYATNTTNTNHKTSYNKIKTIDQDGWTTCTTYKHTHCKSNQSNRLPYLFTISKYISNCKIKYQHYYKNESYDIKIKEQLHKSFEQKYEKIHCEFVWQQHEYIKYLERNYHEAWWIWIQQFITKHGVVLHHNGVCSAYTHCANGYLSEEYDVSSTRQYLLATFIL